MKIRSFNESGIDAFRNFLDSIRNNPLIDPIELLEDPFFSFEVSDHDVTSQNFKNRLEAGEWLTRTLDLAAIADPSKDVGLWAWLSLLHFNCVCPSSAKGERKPKNNHRYIPEVNNFQLYYRHLLLGPWSIVHAYRSEPQIALCVLCQPIDAPGDIVETFASRRERITNKALLAAATRIYVDPKTSVPRRGASGKTDGGARRLEAFCNQLDVTYDLYAIDADELIVKLPKEFNRFRFR